MPSIKNITAKQLLRFLLKQNFLVHHQKGSHIQLRKDHFFVTIPYHGNKILRIKTTLSVLKQAGFTKEYFLKEV
jgi:predicted RNA binding protein YcfA (HicA-like mRNA interferase family)